LSRFLRRVWQEQAEAHDELAPDTVHDLRVALRRCRSLAEGFSELDSHRDWREFRKAARRLQRGLAELRDAQVMAGWVRRLSFTGGTAGGAVAASLRRDERKARGAARSALAEFPRKRWKRWRRRLPQRAGRLAASPASFAVLASQRAGEAGACERGWRKSGSRIAAHRLRIAVKRFRYTVESFLPEQYAAWGQRLKRMQDCLGEIHDLDVLRGRILQLAKQESLSRTTLRTWLRRIERARRQRVERYWKVVSPKARTVKPGKSAPVLWDRWGQELYAMAWINPPKSAGASGSEASAVGLPAEKIPAPRGKRLPPS
jgi:CHAD domain-containing protein